MKLIEIKSVSKFFSKKPAVLDFSLDMEEGERVVLLGPSGCGKTTVLRMLAGFIPPDDGAIVIDGQLVAERGHILKQPEERNLGMVFQDLALWPHLSVRGNIELGLKAHGISVHDRTQRIHDILMLFEMLEYVDAKPAELSGGQQQRVALARALALHPKLLLMDEPLSSLDLDLNLRLRVEILGIQEKIGFTLMYITHDRDEAFEIGKRIVLMKAGQIERHGSPHEVERYLQELSTHR